MKSVPPYTELMNPVMNALKMLGGSGSVQEINDKVIEQLQIPDEVANIPLSEKRSESKLQNRLGWARSYLRKAGILDNPGFGFWAIMPGQQDKRIQPSEIQSKLRKQGNEAKQAYSPDAVDDGEYLSENENEPWRDELLTVLTETLTPSAFEHLAKNLLHRCGFVEVKVTGKSGDGGIDGIGIAKVNDLMSLHVIFQCKRYKHTRAIGPDAIRTFRGAMANRANKGLFITTASFTKGAREEATRVGTSSIDLIDGEQLMDKLKELRLGIEVEVETVEKVTIDKNWYQSINDLSSRS